MTIEALDTSCAIRMAARTQRITGQTAGQFQLYVA